MLLMFRDWNFFDFSPLLVFADTKYILDHFASERHKTSSLQKEQVIINFGIPRIQTASHLIKTHAADR